MKLKPTPIAYLTLTILFLIVCVKSTMSQSHVENEYPTTCEDAISRTALALQQNERRKNEKARFFVVGRSGLKEKEGISELRLLRVKEHLSVLKPRFDVSILRGEPTTGLGRIEFYVDGVLAEQILFRKEAVLDLNRCSIP